MLESEYQAELIKKLEKLLPGAIVLKNDEQYRPGIPDLTVFYGERWAMLEVKQNEKSPYRPNQEWYLEQVNGMSYSATIYPSNEKEVLREVQSALQPNRPTR